MIKPVWANCVRAIRVYIAGSTKTTAGYRVDALHQFTDMKNSVQSLVRGLPATLWVVLMVVTSQAAAQFTGLEVVEVADHDTTDLPQLAGMTTYRLYANLSHADDVVSAVYGDEINPLLISTSEDFFNSSFGDDLAQSINTLFYSSFPEVEYDSWLTIGYAPGDPVLGNVGTVGMMSDLAAFNEGDNILLNDPFGGSWFVTTDQNAIAGEDLKVLLGQFTTSGTLQGTLNIQVFSQGDQSNEQLVEQIGFFAGATVPGCTDAGACNYDAAASSDDGSCEYPAPGLDCAGECLDPVDENGNGICDAEEVLGCPYPSACNYNPEANVDNGTCEFFCPGCTDPAACNYEEGTLQNDGSCWYPVDEYGSEYVDCDGVCLSDVDDDGICDELEVPGCLNPFACNFNADATDGDDSCEFTSCAGCMYEFACNYDPEAIVADLSCEFGTCPGCTDPAACNYNPTVFEDDGSCTYLDACGVCGGDAPDYLNCDGSCVNDTDGDGVCDELEVFGCNDHEACNFNLAATESDGSCLYAFGCDTCSGELDGTGEVINNDTDGDGVCDGSEVPGCTDEEACNFNAEATDSDGSCVFAQGCDYCSGATDGTGFIVSGDENENGICDDLESAGCTYEAACNFDPEATTDDGSCAFAAPGVDCAGNCLSDVDGNLVCDNEDYQNLLTAMEEGDFCAPGTVWNVSLGQCVASYCQSDLDGNGVVEVADLLVVLGDFGSTCSDGGCTDPSAQNYTPAADYDNGTCAYGPDACDGLDALFFNGYAYDLVTIGSQCWFSENLRTAAYANGDALQSDLDSLAWGVTDAGAQAFYGDELANGVSWGRLYNWWAVMDGRGLCPTGFHVSTDAEWQSMEAHLGMSELELDAEGFRGNDEGLALKSSAINSPAWNGSNASGFAGLPTGGRFAGAFLDGGNGGYWWTASEAEGGAWSRELYEGFGAVGRYAASPEHGYAVRCVMD